MFKLIHRQNLWGRLLRGLIAYVLVLQLAAPARIFANPVGGNVVAGQAAINGGAGTLTVNQASQRAIINWQDFSIAHGELTKFVQPSASSAVLNRVIGSNLSGIYGTLQANGQVFLINPNGIVIGPTGVVNTGGFVASTLDVDNNQFLAGGDLNFKGNSTAKVINMGKIGAATGDVIMIAQEVENHGEIKAPNGKAALAAGNEVLVKASGQERIFVQAGKGKVSNSGLIESATAELKAAGGNEYALAINNTGTVRATGAVNEGGRILLKANNGKIKNSGTLTAKGTKNAKAEVKVLAEKVELTNSSKVETLGGGFVELSGYGKLTYGGTVVTEGGKVLIDPAVLTIAASGGDMTAADVVALLNDSDTTLQADDIIYIDEIIDASGNANAFNLVLDTAMLNLNEGITLVTGATISGTATTVNVGEFGFVQNGIDTVASGGTVNLDSVTYTLTQQLTIGKSLTLTGEAGFTILDANANSGDVRRVMQIDRTAGGIAVTLDGLTLTNGYTNDEGGGLLINGATGGSATVNILNSRIIENWGGSAGGGISVGSSASSEGDLALLIRNSTVANNTSLISGGGLNVLQLVGTASVSIENSTFSSNGAAIGAGIFSSAPDLGAPVPPGIAMTIRNSTFTGNSGGFGGILYSAEGTVTISNSTLSGNAAATAGGIYVASGSVSIGQSILAGNIGSGGSESNVTVAGGSFTSLGYNLYGQNSDAGGFAGALPTDILLDSGIDAVLAPLAYNGGPTETMALITGSTAAYMKGGANSGGQLDQRGQARGSVISIGAYDFDVADLEAVVTTTDDEMGNAIGGPELSLREAIWYANSGILDNPTIIFDESGVFFNAQTITLSSALGQLLINSSLGIVGSVAGVTIDAAASSSDLRRVMQIDRVTGGIDVTLDGLTLTGGYSNLNGGGLMITGLAGGSATVTINNSQITGNQGASGGGIAIGGDPGTGVSSLDGDLELAIRNSSVSDNIATGNAGGIYLLQDVGDVEIDIENSTFSGNQSNNNGGALYLYLANYSASAPPPSIELTVRNSTFTDNRAATGAVMRIIANNPATVSATILNSTITGNIGGGGALNLSTNASLSLGGSIVAGNSDNGGGESDVGITSTGVFTSLGYNLYGQNGNAGGFTGALSTDILLAGDINTVLAPLADNGGPTQTMALITGSAAYLKGGANSGGQLDQRGQARGSVISIGAWDFDVADLEAVVTTADDTFGNVIGGDDVSLRDAIWFANSGVMNNPTITFDEEGVFSTAQTITLSSALGQLALTASQSILGSAAGVTIDANASSTDQRRVMQITANAAGVDVTLGGLTLTGGYTTLDGGGIFITAGSGTTGNINLDRVQIADNYGGSGGGIEVAGNGGVVNLNISNSTITNNRANGSGGAMRIIDLGGGITTNISNSTIANNVAGANGGAIYNYAPVGFTNLTILNSTIVGNSTTAGSTNGGGIRNGSLGTVTIGRSIVAGNTHAGGGESDFVQDAGDPLVSLGYNLYGQNSDAGGWTPVGTDILLTGAIGTVLNPLADNGGPTQTMALITGSAAYLKGGANSGGQLDQRGQARGSVISIGAWDFDADDLSLVVNTTDDTFGNVIGGPDLTLRDAIWYANSGALINPAITFDESGVFSTAQTIVLALGQLSLSASQSILGSAAGVTIDANQLHRVMQVTAGTVLLQDLTLTGGFSDTPGSGLLLGAGINNAGNLTLNRSTVTGNVIGTPASPGGFTLPKGGGIYNSGILTLIQSTVSNNSVSGEQPWGGGIYNFNGTVTLNQSTVSGNSVVGTVDARGGGVYSANSGTLIVNQSTISDNTASGSSGVFEGGGIYSRGVLTIGGTIVAGNTAGTQMDYAGSGSISSSGYNLSSFNFGGTGDIVFTGDINTLLNPLANNGGRTQTMSLVSGSAAIGAGGANSGYQVDQRGLARKAIMDIGAYETDAWNPYLVTSTGDTSTNTAGELRTAINFANANPYANPEISFDESGVFSGAQTITLTLGQLTLTASQSILGSAAGVTIDANSLSRVMLIDRSAANTEITLDGLTFTNGVADFGGGIRVDGTGNLNLLIRNSTIAGNKAESGGGLLVVLGASSIDRVKVAIENSTISGNEAVDYGGGIFAQLPGTPGANWLELDIKNSTFAENKAEYGGAIMAATRVRASILDSTISGNEALDYAGGIYLSGDSELSIGGSILAGNTAPVANDITVITGGIFTSLGYNLYGQDAVANGFVPVSTDILLTGGIDTVLAPLADNGGPTKTMGLVTGSVAYMGGAYDGNYTYDQRGVLRGLNKSIGAWDLNIGLINVDPLVTNAGDTPSVIGTTDLSLRDAIWYANLRIFGPSPEIEFDEAGVFATAQTINLLHGQLEINRDMGIYGSAAGVTIDAGGNSRVLQINGRGIGTFVELENLVLTGGATAGVAGDATDAANYGGGIYVSAGEFELASVHLHNTTVQNSSAAWGGGIALNSQDGGVVDLLLERAVVSGNTASQSGGGIFAKGSGIGGGVAIETENASIMGNTATEHGGGLAMVTENGGAAIGDLIFATFGNNQAGGMGGGIYLSAGAGSIAGVSIGNVTIANNQAGTNGGGIALLADTLSPSAAVVEMVNSTLTGNVAGAAGGGIYYDAGPYGYVASGGNIVAGNGVDDGINPVVESDYVQGAGSTLNALLTLGWNLYGQNGNDGGFVAQTIPGAGADILLATGIGTVVQTDGSGKVVLANNGGRTMTVALVVGSVAIDAGNAGSGALIDQRGVGRGPLGNFTGTTDDIGAYEAQVIRITADDQNITYGDAEPAYTYQITNNGDATGLLSGSPAAVSYTGNAGTYVIGQGALASLDSNYLIAFTDGELVVDQREITVSIDDFDRVYDGTTDAAATAIVTLGDLVTGDSLSGGTFTFDTRNVGSGKTVTVSGVTVADGNSGNNYLVTLEDNTNSSISVFDLVVTAQSDSRGYDGTADSAVAPVLGTVFAGDSITTAATQVFDNRNVGTGKTLTASGLVIDDGNGGNNYNISYVDDTTGEITAAALTVTAQTDSRGYNGTDSSSVGPVVTGTLYDAVGTTATQIFDNKNVGTGKALTASGLVINDGNGGNNYSITYVDDTTGEITAAALTVTAQTDSRGYNGTDSSAVGPVLTGTLYDAVGTAATQIFDNKNVGTGKALTASGLVINDGNGGNNYSITYVDDTTGEITAAALTVTAQTDSRGYNGTDSSAVGPVVTGTLYDAVGTAATQVFDNKNVGTGKTLTASGLVINDGNGGNNYSISYVDDTTGEITAAALTVTAQTDSRGYNGTDSSAVGPVVTGTLYDAVGTAATQVFDNKNVGTGKTLTASDLVVDDGNGGNNYSITYVNDTTGVITAANLTVTAQTDNRVYNGTVSSAIGPVVTGTLYDAIGIAATQVFDTKDVGTGKTLAASGLVMDDGNGGNNYSISYVDDMTGVITQATLVINANAGQGKIYGNADSALAFTATGLFGADSVAGAQVRAAGENVGGYAISQGSLDAGSNYLINYNGANFAITPRPITVTAGSGFSIYGQSPANPGIALTGGSTAFADTLASLGLGNDFNIDSVSGVGIYSINVTGSSSNYAITRVDGAWRVLNPLSRFAELFSKFQRGQANDENDTVDGVTDFTGSGEAKVTYGPGGAKVPGALVHVSSGEVD